MRHHNKNRTFGRERKGRTALLRGLALSLIEHEKIQTTEAKAKELRPFVEELITKGKQGTMHARRLVSNKLGEPTTGAVKKLFDDVAKRYGDRQGGYTRIVKLGETPAGRREAYIELV